MDIIRGVGKAVLVIPVFLFVWLFGGVLIGFGTGVVASIGAAFGMPAAIVESFVTSGAAGAAALAIAIMAVLWVLTR